MIKALLDGNSANHEFRDQCPIVCWRDFLWLWQIHRSIVRWVRVGLSIFLLGGFGAEAVKQGLHDAFSAESTITLAGQQNGLLFLSEQIRITIEEFAELLGETLILFGVTQFVLQSLAASQEPDIPVRQ